jgi:hypothetical protein
VVPVVAGVFAGWRARAQQSTALATHNTPDATNLNNNLFSRVSALEERLDIEEAKCSRLERIVNRVCWGYEMVHRLLLRFVNLLKADKPVPPHMIKDAEETPDLDQLLKLADRDHRHERSPHS